MLTPRLHAVALSRSSQETDGETLLSELLANGGAGTYDMIFVDAGERVPLSNR